MSARFLISIISYRLESGVERCIESVLHGGGNFKLHLTANGSPTVAGVLKKTASDEWRHDFELVVNPENLGFIPPNERAMAYAQKHGYDFLCTLNDDATVPHGWLDAIEAEFARHPAAAIVGPTGGCRTLNSDFHGYSGTTLDYIEGTCACYRVGVWKKHFKTLYEPWLEFAYSEDSTASLRVRKLGFTIHEAAFKIEHARGSTSKHVPKAKVYQERNHALAKVRYSHFLKHRTFSHRIIVKRTYAVGDCLLASGVVRQLWRENPLCEILVETNSPDLFSGNPHVAHAAHAIQRRETDLVINLDGSYEATPMRSIVRSYAQTAGVELESTATEFHVSPADAEWAAKKLSVDEKFVALHAGPSNWAGKNWPMERWVEVLRHLSVEGYFTVLVGAQVNPKLSEQAAVDLCGKTTLGQAFAIMARCEFAISIDSFPLHCAQAVGTPVIGLFGVTTPEFICTDGSKWIAVRSSEFHPDTGLRHRVANATMVNCSDDVMRTIEVPQVVEAIEQMAGSKIEA